MHSHIYACIHTYIYAYLDYNIYMYITFIIHVYNICTECAHMSVYTICIHTRTHTRAHTHTHMHDMIYLVHKPGARGICPQAPPLSSLYADSSPALPTCIPHTYQNTQHQKKKKTHSTKTQRQKAHRDTAHTDAHTHAYIYRKIMDSN